MKKNYYNGLIKTIILIILMPFILYKCSFSKTYHLYKDYKRIQSMEELLVYQISYDSLSTWLPPKKENILSNGRLVELINPVCEKNNISIIKYDSELVGLESNLKLYAANLVLAGNYIDLIKMLRYWEDNIRHVKISSLKYEYDKKKMKDEKIEMAIAVRQIEIN